MTISQIRKEKHNTLENTDIKDIWRNELDIFEEKYNEWLLSSKKDNLIPNLSTSNLSTSDLSIRSFIFSIRSFIFSLLDLLFFLLDLLFFSIRSFISSIRSFISSIRSFIFSIRSFIFSIRSFISSIRSFFPGNSVSPVWLSSGIGSHSDLSKYSI